jgi:branched-chain amino acid transport system permease protein
VVSAAMAVPLLRLHDDYFVIGTLAVEVVISAVLLNWVSVTNGPIGLAGIPYASIFGFALDSYGTFIYLAVIVALIAIVCTWRISASPTAALLRGIRDDEVAVTALGRNVRRLKVYITVYSAIWLGVGGALYAYLITALDPTQFSVTTAIFILAIVIVGGTGTVYGPVLGAILLVPLPEILSFVGVDSDTASELRNIGYGLVLIVLMRLRPQGLLGERTTFRRQRNQPQLTPFPGGSVSAPPDGETVARADVTS